MTSGNKSDGTPGPTPRTPNRLQLLILFRQAILELIDEEIKMPTGMTRPRSPAPRRPETCRPDAEYPGDPDAFYERFCNP